MICCDVTRPGGGSDYPIICDDHKNEGWFVVVMGDTRRADTVDSRACGCQVSTIYQWPISKCAAHKVGPVACCGNTRAINCVCMYSYQCSNHGERHIGSHE